MCSKKYNGQEKGSSGGKCGSSSAWLIYKHTCATKH